STATFDPGPGRISAAQAAKRHHLKLNTLCRAIDAGIVRGRRVEIGRDRCVRTVDPDELAEDLANLPTCGYPGCERRALAPSGACSGPHARALETKGRNWRSAEAIARSAE